jgi:6-phosphogluconolactonase
MLCQRPSGGNEPSLSGYRIADCLYRMLWDRPLTQLFLPLRAVTIITYSCCQLGVYEVMHNVRRLAGLLILGSQIGCGGSGSSPLPNREFLYVTGDSQVVICSLDNKTGTLSDFRTVIPGPQVSNAIAVHPSSKFLYLSDDMADSVIGYAINPSNGDLTPLDSSPFNVGTFGQFTGMSLAFDSTGQFLYITEPMKVGTPYNTPGSISTFSVDPTTGALSRAGPPVTGGYGLKSALVHPSDLFLFVADADAYGGLEVYAIDSSSGLLTAVAGSPFNTGLYSNSSNILTIDPTGKYVYVGSYAIDQVHNADLAVLSIDTATGALAPLPGSPFNPGLVGSVAVGPSNGLLYVSVFNYLYDWSIGVYSIYPASGVPTNIGSTSYSPDITNISDTPCCLTFDLSGKFLFIASNGLISAFSVDSTGLLTELPGSPYAGVPNPTSMARAAEPAPGAVESVEFSGDGFYPRVR